MMESNLIIFLMLSKITDIIRQTESNSRNMKNGLRVI